MYCIVNIVLKRRVRAAHGRVVRPNPTSILRRRNCLSPPRLLTSVNSLSHIPRLSRSTPARTSWSTEATRPARPSGWRPSTGTHYTLHTTHYTLHKLCNTTFSNHLLSVSKDFPIFLESQNIEIHHKFSCEKLKIIGVKMFLCIVYCKQVFKIVLYLVKNSNIETK